MLTEALEGRMKSVEIELKETKAQLEWTPFRFRVRGPPDSMHIIKMDTRTRRWEVVEVHN